MKPFSDTRVKYDTQVMNQSDVVAILTLLATGDLPAIAKPTAEFLERMEKLFDWLNRSKIKQAGDKLCYAVREQSEHLSFLEHCLPWIESWRIGPSESRCQTPHHQRMASHYKGCNLHLGRASPRIWFTFPHDSQIAGRPITKLFFGLVRPQHGRNGSPTVFQIHC